MNILQALDGSGVAPAAEGEEMDFPPAASLDDRRLHVRAWKRWTASLNGRSLPSIRDVEPCGLDGPNSVLLDLRGGRDDPAVARLGSALLLECGARGIATVADIPEHSLLARLAGHYPVILAIAEPMAFEGEHLRPGGQCLLYRGILLPLSAGGGSIDFIHGMISCREYADSGLAAEIAFEAGPHFADLLARRAATPASQSGVPAAAMTDPFQPELPLSA
ncbi:MAG TPA: hypothetical protein VNT77_02060 [Allosphingosinicella sp.]|nr:hypothetical protein [Allosphingosinicella sp.]